jgi:hypothetical protein
MSLIKVKVIDTTLTTREGLSKNNKPYKMNSQSIIVEFDGEVRKVELTLPDNVSAYAPGNYTIDPIELIAIGRYGFEFKRFHEIKLVPVSGSVASMGNKAA